jgi:parallel beta-helix repeat protein
MKARSLGLAAAALVVCSAQLSLAATCPDMSPPAITAASEAGAKCQSAIAKNASKFIGSKMKTESKCIMQFDETACPNTDDDAKVISAAQKSADKIEASCDEAGIVGLSSSYNAGLAGGFTGATVASCVLSQSNVEAKVMIGISNGPPASWGGPAERGKCASAVSGAANKFVKSMLKSVNKCVDAQVKAGTAGDLGPVCIGSWTGGTYTQPTDSKASDGISKAIEKAEASVQKSCGDNAVAAANIATLFSCEGAQTADDLKNCVVCNNWANLLNVVEAQYSESGTLVQPGPGALQDAVDAAADGDKLLIASGDYDEEVVVATNNLALVGCGGATDERPTITPPALPVSNRGIFSAAVDGALYQSLSPNGWAGDGIFVTGANGVTFRDIVADGEQASTYSVFPVESSNVTVEVSEVENVIDAGIYIGQAIGCVSRYNYVHKNVAGMEIENSDTCDVYGNLAKGNNAGLLVFELTAPALQLSQNHEISHNVSTDNNYDTAVVAPGIVGQVPSGTGYLVISTDNSDFHHNLATNNGSFGFAFLDQLSVNALAAPNPEPFDPPSVNQKAENCSIHDNKFAQGAAPVGNGNAPDSTAPNATPLSGTTILALGDDTNHNNCFQNNQDGGGIFLSANDCTP